MPRILVHLALLLANFAWLLNPHVCCPNLLVSGGGNPNTQMTIRDMAAMAAPAPDVQPSNVPVTRGMCAQFSQGLHNTLVSDLIPAHLPHVAITFGSGTTNVLPLTEPISLSSPAISPPEEPPRL